MNESNNFENSNNCMNPLNDKLDVIDEENETELNINDELSHTKSHYKLNLFDDKE